MPQCSCPFCGQSFTVISAAVRGMSDRFCNLGCAVRSRVPVDANGNFPVNRHLIWPLVVAFLYFNQVLIAGVAKVLERREQVGLSLRMAWISFVLGLLVWLGTVALQRLENVARGKDHVVSGLALAILSAAIWRTEPRVGLAAAACAILLVWNFRGIVRAQHLTRPGGA